MERDPYVAMRDYVAAQDAPYKAMQADDAIADLRAQLTTARNDALEDALAIIKEHHRRATNAGIGWAELFDVFQSVSALKTPVDGGADAA
jgi:hypothetical protein